MKRRKKPPKKTGRPTLYDPDGHPKIARKIIGEGKTLGDLAEMLGVSRFTIDQWRTNHAEFSGHIELGRDDQTDRVERSLLERATGYDRTEERLMVVSGGVGAGSSVERHKLEAHYPPDVSAAKFWLTNRRRKEWKERSSVELSGLEGLVARLAAARKRVGSPAEENK